MRGISDVELLEAARAALEAILGGEVELRVTDDGDVMGVLGTRFAVATRRGAGAGAVAAGLSDAVDRAARIPGTWPLLVVPSVGPTARALARARSVAVLDPAGNAELHADGLRVVVEGRRAKRPPGRPHEPFSAASVPLVLGALLMSRGFSRSALAARVHAQPSTAGRVLARLAALGLVDAEGGKTLRVRRPRALYELVRARWSSLPFERLEASIEARSPAARDAALAALTEPPPRVLASDVARTVAVSVRLPDAGARALAGLRVVRERGALSILVHPGLHAIAADDAGSTLLAMLEAGRVAGSPRTDLAYATRFGTLR